MAVKDKSKQSELEKYEKLNLATLDYYISSKERKIKTKDFDSDQHYKALKEHVKTAFKQGKLTMLKQWFNDLTEELRETEDFYFNDFIKETTGIDINIHERFDKRISKIISRQKIKTSNEYRDILTKVDYLTQLKSPDQDLLSQLNSLLIDFEKAKK